MVDTLNTGDSISKTIASILDDISEEQAGSIEQLRSINVRLEVEGTSVQIKPSVKFRSDSELLKVLEERSGELMFLDELPNRAAMNGVFKVVHSCSPS